MLNTILIIVMIIAVEKPNTIEYEPAPAFKVIFIYSPFLKTFQFFSKFLKIKRNVIMNM